MATKKTTVTEKEKAALMAALDYFELSHILFNGKDDCPYDINELKPDSMFYDKAMALAKELEIPWKTMTHDESNRIMLALLEEHFMAINVDEGMRPTLTISLKPKEKDG